MARKSPHEEKTWDPVRRRAVAATPEERVRQAFIAYLTQKGCPLSAIQVEYAVGESGRFDVAVMAPEGTLWLLAECKSGVVSPESAWRTARTQLSRYSRALPMPKYFAIVIGQHIWCWHADKGTLCPEFPTYPQ